ncbi:4Fe-4S binding protein [Desulfovibrio desulfuricans]|uniref:4Fe-4S binding protein n=1 Tax=Desulfovibrio desulfuricans TaxID=876 RepID=UPI0035AE43CF
MSASVYAVFFSPTGSSRTMAQELADIVSRELSLPRAQDWDWTFPEGRAASLNIAAGDVLVFAFPVYAGRIPVLLHEPLSRLKGQGASIVPLAVYGNRHYDDALLEAVDTMLAQKFAVPAAGAFVAEHSYTSKVGTGRPDAADMAALSIFGRDTARIIARGGLAAAAVPGKRPYKALPPPADIRPHTSESCTGCGLCVSVCPMRIINENNPADVAQGCLRCCACVKICPEQAKSFDDPQTNRIIGMLEGTCQARREPEVFFAG